MGFLIFDLPNGLAIVDPHAAHGGILYEEIAVSFKEGIATQNLTMPVRNTNFFTARDKYFRKSSRIWLLYLKMTTCLESQCSGKI